MYTISCCDMPASPASLHIHEAAGGRGTGGGSLHRVPSEHYHASMASHAALQGHGHVPTIYQSPASMASFTQVPSFTDSSVQQQQRDATMQPKYKHATMETEYDTCYAHDHTPSTQLSHEQLRQAHQGFAYHQVAQQQRYSDVVQLLGLGPSSPAQSTSPVAGVHVSTLNKDFMNAGGAGRGLCEEDDDDDDDGDDEEDFADDVDKGSITPGCGTRWPRQETLALLKTRSEMDSVFRDSVSKAPLWEEVSRKLALMGYYRSAKKCKEKFENVYKYYKRTRSSGRQEGKRYRFSLELEALCHSNKNSVSYSASINDLAETSMSNQNNCDGAFMSPKVMTTRIGAICDGMIDELDYSYTSTSDDDTNDVCAGTKKKKRKASVSKKECLDFFQNLVEKVLVMQSKMQQRLLETIQRQDQERLAREEAWRSQMLAKIKKEDELRAQERIISASRTNVLVEFLQRVTGQTLKLSTSINSTSYNRNDNDYIHDEDLFDDPVRQWSKAEILALVKLRVSLNNKFAKDDSSIWEEVSLSMSLQGYVNRTAMICKVKWERIMECFKQAKQAKRAVFDDDKMCPVISLLNILQEDEKNSHTYFGLKHHNEHINEGIKDFNDHINQVSIRQQNTSVCENRQDIASTMPSSNYVTDNTISFSTDGREIASRVLPSLQTIVRSNGNTSH